MPLEDRRAWTLLRQLDDPEHLEFPRGYDHMATRALFEQLASRLGQRFQCACFVDRGVEYASHHGTIVIPRTSTVSGEHITVTVSNFGNLAAVTLGNPGSYDEGEENILFEAADRQRIDDGPDTTVSATSDPTKPRTPRGGGPDSSITCDAASDAFIQSGLRSVR